ncbi:MAG: hypothetical protein ACOYZ7_20455 [Chloroflexota bacterium]
MDKQVRVNLTMPESLKREARARAIREGKNLSLVVRELLEAWLEGKVDLPPPEPSQEGE